MTVQGIDVASYQSAAYDTTGLDFVFIKATEGVSYINPKQQAQAAHGRAAGCVVGFYHFLHPGSVQAQAEFFVARCASQAGDILVCDWEPTSSGTASNADKDNFIKAVKRLRPDHRVVLYCDVSRWTGGDRTSYAGDGLWIADPNHPAGRPDIKAPWLFHQYGIRGTDRDIANFPTRAALAAWAAGTTEEDPLASFTKQDVHDAVWRIDDITAPADAPDAKTNPTWQPQSFLKDTNARIRGLEKQVAALAGTNAKLVDTVAKLATGLGDLDPAAIVQELKTAIESIDVHLDVTTPTP